MVVQVLCFRPRKVNGKTQFPHVPDPDPGAELDVVVVVVVVMGLSEDKVVPDPEPPPELDSHVQGSGVLVDGPHVLISGI